MRIDALETASTLHDRLAVVGAALLARTLAAVGRGRQRRRRFVQPNHAHLGQARLVVQELQQCMALAVSGVWLARKG